MNRNEAVVAARPALGGSVGDEELPAMLALVRPSPKSASTSSVARIDPSVGAMSWNGPSGRGVARGPQARENADVAKIGAERAHETRLARAGLAADEHDPARAGGCVVQQAVELRQELVPFHKLHGTTLRLGDP